MLLALQCVLSVHSDLLGCDRVSAAVKCLLMCDNPELHTKAVTILKEQQEVSPDWQKFC